MMVFEATGTSGWLHAFVMFSRRAVHKDDYLPVLLRRVFKVCASHLVRRYSFRIKSKKYSVHIDIAYLYMQNRKTEAGTR